ncbi:glutamate--tRNA ligase [Ammoniphilus sp. YIM 78166]|uniref:glutamate--tRNA ligase n=1 Tax=Ammoniphilus sp. YIM 78166 TaxID=1644106 RepID=UPI0010702437|nr:glutamate--tRNA ligase [Ammoniphilus sp. YIM 78166]
MSIRVRFAPSPTGHLHLGGARTALFNYLLAKKRGGTFIVRIEDTDQTRNVEKADLGFLENLRWLGLHWDEGPDIGGDYGPYHCMDRLNIYQPYVDRLISEGKAYPCYCTEEELETERQESMRQNRIYKYSGKCRDLNAEQRRTLGQEGRKKTVRFRVPEGRLIQFSDDVRGDMKFGSDDIGDFIMVKSDGIPTYHFAVVVDDHLMKITHVIRGEEHLSNTPRQILIYDAFGWEIPQFAHLALILKPSGKKLSKRDESILQFMDQYRSLGYLPEAMNNFLVLLGWSPEGEQELFTLEEMAASFSLDRLHKSGAIFDQAKLDWMNNYYMRQADPERLIDLAVTMFQQQGLIDDRVDVRWIAELISLCGERISHVGELVSMAEPLLRAETVYSEDAMRLLEEDQVQMIANSFLEKVKEDHEWNAIRITDLMKNIHKETGLKGRSLYVAIRAVVFGETQGPDLIHSLLLLGRETVIYRLDHSKMNGIHSKVNNF